MRRYRFAIPVILDVKRGDIGTTAERYAASAYDIVGADAVTVNPYMGFDAVKPFLRDEKGVFVLCVTSNPTADDFQMLSSEGMPLYQHIATRAVRWSEDGDVGIVMGATRPEVMASIRKLVGDMPILVPGIGAQGGDLESVIRECDAWPGDDCYQQFTWYSLCVGRGGFCRGSTVGMRTSAQ